MSAHPIALFSRLVGLVVSLRPAPKPTQAENSAALLERLYADFDAKVEALVRGLENGKITIGQFTGSMPSLIKQHHLAAAVIAGGGAENATPETYALAQRNVNTQLAYFERWKTELLQQAADGKLPSAAYIANRAKLYGRAAGATASEARTQAMGMPTLPFYTATRTQCRSNCLCSWSIRPLDVVNGNYDCYWVLGFTESEFEHCPTCTARRNACNPLKVRRGQIVDPEKYQAANLYA